MLVRQVDEDLIKKASILQAPNNCFEVALTYAEEYKAAGLTPLFFLDEEETMIYVTTEEKIDGKYN